MQDASDDCDEPEELITDKTGAELRTAIAFRAMGRHSHKNGYALKTILTRNPSLDQYITEGWNKAEAKRLARISVSKKPVFKAKAKPAAAIGSQSDLFGTSPKKRPVRQRYR